MNDIHMKIGEEINLTKDKKGQATVFVIVAILLVAVVVIVFMFYPNISEVVTGQEFNPNGFLKSCVKQDIKTNVDMLLNNGGYSNPEGFILYKGEKIKYLCYTSEYYKTCSVQSPMIKTRFENELNKLSEKKINGCVGLLKKEYEKRGFSVSSKDVKSSVDIVTKGIKVKFETPMTITKEDTRTFKGFEINMESGIYNLLFTAQSIIDFESTLGDSETSLYLQYYPNLKMEKIKLGDGTTVYKLTDVLTKERFRFASRSLAWPPGYGTE